MKYHEDFSGEVTDLMGAAYAIEERKIVARRSLSLLCDEPQAADSDCGVGTQ
jgi:hypothetical protein